MSFIGTLGNIAKGVLGAIGGIQGRPAAPVYTPQQPYYPPPQQTYLPLTPYNPMPISNYPVGQGGVKCPQGTTCSGLYSAGDICIGSCVPISGDVGTLNPAYQAAAAGATGRCPLPAIRGFHWNKSKYHTFGDCRRGTSAGDVGRCTKMVKNRHMNPANGRAALRAARRLKATHSLLKRIEKAVHKAAPTRHRLTTRKRGCGCK